MLEEKELTAATSSVALRNEEGRCARILSSAFNRRSRRRIPRRYANSSAICTRLTSVI